MLNRSASLAMSTNVLKTLPGKLDIKRHQPCILCNYSGDKPSTEDIEGPYPTVVQGPSGKNVLVVQAYAWGKYMGFLNVTFDENFDVVGWSGNPVLLDKSIARGNQCMTLMCCN